MKIRKDMLKSALDEYTDELFNNFDFNITNITNKVISKLTINKYIDSIADMLKDNEGLIDIDMLESTIMPEIKRLGVIEIPAIGTKYRFREDDFIILFNKIKEKANG
ncbi:MAG: hypothetical protein IKH36_02045 [Bacilli bacterium]|nr:hypothetical protein [Bacilli bacterium]